MCRDYSTGTSDSFALTPKEGWKKAEQHRRILIACQQGSSALQPVRSCKRNEIATSAGKTYRSLSLSYMPRASRIALQLWEARNYCCTYTSIQIHPWNSVYVCTAGLGVMRQNEKQRGVIFEAFSTEHTLTAASSPSTSFVHNKAH